MLLFFRGCHVGIVLSTGRKPVDSSQLQEVIALFSRTALEICEGQQFDMEFENRNDVSEREYLDMIRLKTAVLLACSLKLGLFSQELLLKMLIYYMK